MRKCPQLAHLNSKYKKVKIVWKLSQKVEENKMPKNEFQKSKNVPKILVIQPKYKDKNNLFPPTFKDEGKRVKQFMCFELLHVKFGLFIFFENDF